MTKNLTILAALALQSYAIGSLINIFRDEPLGMKYETPASRLINKQAQPEAIEPSNVSNETIETVIHENIKMVELDELLEWVKNDKVIIIDVRPSLFFQIGCIKGAHNLQIKEFEKDYAVQKSLLQKAEKEGKEIVLYCAGPHCPDASKVAAQLKAMSHVNLCVFEGGWEEWEAAGLPTDSSL